MIGAVCVYCGSASGTRAKHAAAAQAFGTALAQAGLTLVYGGGRVGLMGLLADSVLAAGGRAIGVIPELLLAKEVGHTGLSELHVVPGMHERKQLMADLADAFVALPGGAGTLEEFFEVFTWTQLGYHRKPVALLNVAGYYNPLLALLRHTVDEGFMHRSYLDTLTVQENPADLLAALRRYAPPSLNKWETVVVPARS